MIGTILFTSGTITFQGQAIGQLKGITLKNFRKECQLVFQDTLTSLNPVLRMDIIDKIQIRRGKPIPFVESIDEIIKKQDKISAKQFNVLVDIYNKSRS